MQIKSLQLKSYRSWKINETIVSEVATQKRDRIFLYDKLRKNGCFEAVALEAITTSRTTFFRWQRSYREYGIKGLLEKSKKPINTKQRLWERDIYLKILMRYVKKIHVGVK